MERRFANIALIGVSGAGKSTVARLLAERMGWEAVDTDAAVVAASGRAIADIFETEGEETFRDREAEAVRAACAGKGRVIATGGGAVLREANRDALWSRCLVVWLEAEPTDAAHRVLAGEKRPLLGGADPEKAARELLGRRAPLYALADLRIATTHRTPEQVADEILTHPRSLGARA